MYRLNSTLHTFITQLKSDTIPENRKVELENIAKYINETKAENETLIFNFVCTHNSRRSHFAQIWAQAISYYYQMKKTICFSSGTEETRIYPSVIKTLDSQGFSLEQKEENENPLFHIHFGKSIPALFGFSKTIDHSSIPNKGVIVITTCSDADKNCPFIPGAKKRFRLPFEDPKISDGTALEMEHYAERSLQIASEMKYLFSKINS
ncbi:MAG: protein-tyrosine-phosphatase [Flavobacteriales bacterium]|jgi:arsenate reductase|nr:protein-tyrosine-phosphatase [Flavobacteriales bacterium]